MSNNDKIEERKGLVEQILEDAPRLQKSDKFKFSCQPGITCFNRCCADVNIMLTPYDILRMSRYLKMSTSDFLAVHTVVPFNEEQKLPFVFLEMNKDEKKTCPFVTEAGCGIYESRPWPCRMYPVGQASPGDAGVQGEGFFFLMQEDHCMGHNEERTFSIEDWMDDQGVSEYEKVGKEFKELILHPYLEERPLDPARMEMFYMACYDLDKFRKFVLESNFLDRFILEDKELEAIKSDDIELMRFAFRWLRFALFGEITLKLNEELLSERERDLLKNKINS
jgi:uncharacterized protein